MVTKEDANAIWNVTTLFATDSATLRTRTSLDAAVTSPTSAIITSWPYTSSSPIVCHRLRQVAPPEPPPPEPPPLERHRRPRGAAALGCADEGANAHDGGGIRGDSNREDGDHRLERVERREGIRRRPPEPGGEHGNVVDLLAGCGAVDDEPQGRTLDGDPKRAWSACMRPGIPPKCQPMRWLISEIGAAPARESERSRDGNRVSQMSPSTV